MTLQDLPPSLSIIAERHLARAKAALEELGIDTAGMPDGEIFDRAKGGGQEAAPPAPKGKAAPPGHQGNGRRAATWTGARWHRSQRRDWRRRSRAKTVRDTPVPE